MPGAPANAELVAVRHGESVANVAFSDTSGTNAEELRRKHRDADVPLSAQGRKQAGVLGQWLAGQPAMHVIYCSPYLRASETLRLALAELVDGIAPAVRVDERLRNLLNEIDPGQRTLVVTHDAVVLMLRYLTEAMAEPDLLRVVPVENAAVSVWRPGAGGQLRLVQYNDLSYQASTTTVLTRSLKGPI